MDSKYKLINVYAPNTESEKFQFLTLLEQTIELHQGESFIDGADWNIVRDISIDQRGCIHNIKRRLNEQLSHLMGLWTLNTTWRTTEQSVERRYLRHAPEHVFYLLSDLDHDL